MAGTVSGHELVRSAALCEREREEGRRLTGAEKTEFELEFQEGEDEMSVEGGDDVDGEVELATPDWRVRAGPGNRPTQKEREEHEATHVPFRDWCTHCKIGSGRTHHHVTKQRNGDETQRSTIAMDYYIMKMQPAVNSRTISQEATTCIVEEDRQQNIMCSVALTKGIEEPWTSERVAKVIDLLGYREITLKSDTEPARIAFRIRAAEMCKAEVATEDAVVGDKNNRTAHQKRSNADPWNYSNHQMSHREQHAGTTQ